MNKNPIPSSSSASSASSASPSPNQNNNTNKLDADEPDNKPLSSGYKPMYVDETNYRPEPVNYNPPKKPLKICCACPGNIK